MDSKKIAIGIVALAIVGFAAFKMLGNSSSSKKETLMESTQTQAQTESSNNLENDTKLEKTDTTSTTEYKDGEYTAVGSYEAPPGMEKIGVTVTLKDGVITESSLDKLGKAEISKKMQAAFESGYKELVIGKKIDDIDLDVVAGSSLTPNGFENALDQIKKQAQS